MGRSSWCVRNACSTHCQVAKYDKYTNTPFIPPCPLACHQPNTLVLLTIFGTWNCYAFGAVYPDKKQMVFEQNKFQRFVNDGFIYGFCIMVRVEAKISNGFYDGFEHRFHNCLILDF